MFRLFAFLFLLVPTALRAQDLPDDFCNTSPIRAAAAITGTWMLSQDAGSVSVHAGTNPSAALLPVEPMQVDFTVHPSGGLQMAAMGQAILLEPNDAALVPEEGFTTGGGDPIDLDRIQAEYCDFDDAPSFAGYIVYEFGTDRMAMVVSLTFITPFFGFGQVAFDGRTTQERLEEVIGTDEAFYFAGRPVMVARGIP